VFKVISVAIQVAISRNSALPIVPQQLHLVMKCLVVRTTTDSDAWFYTVVLHPSVARAVTFVNRNRVKNSARP
jgi:hypothetical protein